MRRGSKGSELARRATRLSAGSWAAAHAAAGAVCISASAVLFALANVAPVTGTLYRCALPLPILAVLAVSERRREGPRSLLNHGYAVLAGFFLALNLVFWIHTIADVGAGAATVLGNLQVVFVAFLAWAMTGERPGRLLLVMLPVVLLGVVLVAGVIGGHGSARHPVAGVLFGLTTSATYACFLMILRQTADRQRRAAGQLFDATAGATAAALLLGLTFGGLQLEISWRSLAWLLVLTLTSGIVGWLLITRSIPHLPSTTSALILLLEPVGALILAAIALGQRPSLLQISGAFLVCGGVLIVTGGGRPRRGKGCPSAKVWRSSSGSPAGPADPGTSAGRIRIGAGQRDLHRS